MESNILAFLKSLSPKLCVLSTINTEGKPESAVMGFCIKDDLTVILSTNLHTRKYQNLKNHPNVSLVFGWNFDQKNVQYEGVAITIENGDLYTKTEEFFFGQNPEAAKFKGKDTVFIEIKPTWIRLLDITVHPPVHEEKTF